MNESLAEGASSTLRKVDKVPVDVYADKPHSDRTVRVIVDDNFIVTEASNASAAGGDAICRADLQWSADKRAFNGQIRVTCSHPLRRIK